MIYTYAIASITAGTVNVEVLEAEIRYAINLGSELDEVAVVGTDVTIEFSSPLLAGAKAELDIIVMNHGGADAETPYAGSVPPTELIESHVGSVSQHPLASASEQGFMSPAQVAELGQATSINDSQANAIAANNTLASNAKSVADAAIPKPSPTTDRAIAIYNGAGGLLQNSTPIVETDGDINLLGNKVKGLEDPTNPQDSATKAYADAIPHKYRQHQTGRIYCYSDERWVSPNDDLYGFDYYQWFENAGTGADPILEWEHMGTIMPAGTVLKRIYLKGRANNTQVGDLELAFYKITPSTPGRWQGLGVDSDSEVVGTQILRERFFNPSVGTPMTGAINDIHQRLFSFENIAEATFDVDSELRIYIRPTGDVTATRYFYANFLIETESN